MARSTKPASSVRPAVTRIEKDTMGEMTVPAHALYGASTQRAVLNFPISGRPVPFEIIAAYAAIKSSCASVNERLKRLDPARTRLIRRACDEIAAGLTDRGGWATHFPIDVFQTGSGTSTNMNANEVIANLICLYRDKPIGSSKDAAYLKAGGVHPNDHVNMGQSSNDTFPTSIHVAAAAEICRDLIPALAKMRAQLDKQARAWDRLVKIGRTHLQDATPIRLGQEFSGFASQLAHAENRARLALAALEELPIGGTAVGTGINAHPQFGKLVSAQLTAHYKPLIAKTVSPSLRRFAPANLHPKFREADNHFEAQHAKDGVVEASSHLKTIAVSLSKIASDIRLMGMGPRCGLGELRIPAVQPGSSIMPGKVNPVIVEAMMMVVCQVIGNDSAITFAGAGGVGGLLDLHVAMPVMAERLLESIRLLARGAEVFTDNLLAGLEPDAERCKELIEGSLAMCTSLVPVIGYDRSAALAKEAYKQGKTVRQLALEQKIVSEKDLNKYLDPWSMTLPGGEGSAGG
ncbi:MAG TPA: class II fumarate hydratase [Phycisphaerales bacterium]|nr:class II fumarate hydratase [Phycisphaerales bacterium]